MASAAPAYRYQTHERRQGSRVHVVPGRGVSAPVRVLSPSVLLVVKIFAVFVVVFALLGFARIGLASATVNVAVAAEEVSTQIESARSLGNELEVRESYLANPRHLEVEATKLNMSKATESSTITLAPDVIITDTQGNLSLSRSLQAVSQG